MIKVKAELSDGRPLFLFGLTAENVARMRAGNPIRLSLEPMGGVGEIVIHYGDTELEIFESLKPFIGPNTELHGIPRTQ